MPVTSIWAEMRLDTRAFASGLKDSTRLVGDFGRRMGGMMRSTFMSALNPLVLMRQIAASAAQIQEQMSGLAQQQAELKGEGIPTEEFNRMAVIARDFNLSLEKMVQLWKENSKEAEVFRKVIGGDAAPKSKAVG